MCESGLVVYDSQPAFNYYCRKVTVKPCSVVFFLFCLQQARKKPKKQSLQEFLKPDEQYAESVEMQEGACVEGGEPGVCEPLGGDEKEAEGAVGVGGNGGPLAETAPKMETELSAPNEPATDSHTRELCPAEEEADSGAMKAPRDTSPVLDKSCAGIQAPSAVAIGSAPGYSECSGDGMSAKVEVLADRLAAVTIDEATSARQSIHGEERGETAERTSANCPSNVQPLTTDSTEVSDNLLVTSRMSSSEVLLSTLTTHPTADAQSGRNAEAASSLTPPSATAQEPSALDSLSVPADSLLACLKRFCSRELLTGENKFACEVCSKRKARTVKLKVDIEKNVTTEEKRGEEDQLSEFAGAKSELTCEKVTVNGGERIGNGGGEGGGREELEGKGVEEDMEDGGGEGNKGGGKDGEKEEKGEEDGGEKREEKEEEEIGEGIGDGEMKDGEETEDKMSLSPSPGSGLSMGRMEGDDFGLDIAERSKLPESDG